MRFVVVLALFGFVSSQTSTLHIVVLEGEDAVNIVQQKTAVRPLVEVRDRNNLPVAGATVTFTIGGGQPAAFAGGLQTLTVTTNAAGQAAATGFNVLGPGAIQVQVQAAYQGQIATAAISQTNFATAAAASQAGATTGGSTGAAGGAAGGGGISGTTIGIIGAAAAGGAIAATQVGGDNDTGVAERAGSRRFAGSFGTQFTLTVITGDPPFRTTCVHTRAVNVNVTIDIIGFPERKGQLNFSGTDQQLSVTGAGCPGPTAPGTFSGGGPIDPDTLTFMSQGSIPNGNPEISATVTITEKFNGALSGDTITGTFDHTEIGTGTTNFNGVRGTFQSNAAFSVPVTLRQQ